MEFNISKIVDTKNVIVIRARCYYCRNVNCKIATQSNTTCLLTEGEIIFEVTSKSPPFQLPMPMPLLPE